MKVTAPLVSSNNQEALIAPQSAPITPGFFSLGLAQRLVLLVLLCAAEWVPISNLVHKGRGGGLLLQFAVVFGSFFLAFSYTTTTSAFQKMSREIRGVPIGRGMLVGHFGAFGAFVALSLIPSGSEPAVITYLVGFLWYAAGVASLALAGCAFIPLRSSLELVGSTAYAWVYALGLALIAWGSVRIFPLWNGIVWNPSIDLAWKPATDLTFSLVKASLHLFVSNAIADRATMTIGNPNFKVIILSWCAGFEGTALMLVFGIGWLCFFRREFRFPHALLLIPVGMAVMWLSNVVRITALILIGIAGAPGVAVGGFHSQAGWIAFNCVAVSFAALSHHVRWVRRDAPVQSPAISAMHNPTAAYLMPFLLILTAAMISRAVSGDFEWLYPLRFLAAAVTLWYFRSKYVDLDWKCSWVSVLNGVAVFAVWLGLDLLVGSQENNGIESGLASIPGPARIAWLVFRVAAACITVPIAEEFAFRYFLIRRLISADFESLSPRQYTLVSVLISSVAFGLLHGDRWLAGIVAGGFYAAAFVRRGRIGDAVVAHATTNGLLATWVVLGGRWNLW